MIDVEQALQNLQIIPNTIYDMEIDYIEDNSVNPLLDYMYMKSRFTDFILNFKSSNQQIGVKYVIPTMNQITRIINEKFKNSPPPISNLRLAGKGGLVLRHWATELNKSIGLEKQLRDEVKVLENNISDYDTTFLILDQRSNFNKEDWKEIYRSISLLIETTPQIKTLLGDLIKNIIAELQQKYPTNYIPLRDILGKSIEKNSKYRGKSVDSNGNEYKISTDYVADELYMYIPSLTYKLSLNDRVQDFILFRILGQCDIISIINNKPTPLEQEIFINKLKKIKKIKYNSNFELLDISSDYDNNKIIAETLLGYEKIGNDELYILNFITVLYDNLIMLNEKTVSKPEKRCKRIGLLFKMLLSFMESETFKKGNRDSLIFMFEKIQSIDIKQLSRNLSTMCFDILKKDKYVLHNIDNELNNIKNPTDLIELSSAYINIMNSIISVLDIKKNVKNRDIRYCLSKNTHIWTIPVQSFLNDINNTIYSQIEVFEFYPIGGYAFKRDLIEYAKSSKNLNTTEKDIIDYLNNNVVSFDFDITSIVPDNDARTFIIKYLDTVLGATIFPQITLNDCKDIELVSNIDFLKDFQKTFQGEDIPGVCNTSINPDSCFMYSSSYNPFQRGYFWKVWNLNVMVKNKIEEKYYIQNVVDYSIITQDEIGMAIDICRKNFNDTGMTLNYIMYINNILRYCRKTQLINDDELNAGTSFINILIGHQINNSRIRLLFYVKIKNIPFDNIITSIIRVLSYSSSTSFNKFESLLRYRYSEQELYLNTIMSIPSIIDLVNKANKEYS